MKNIITRTTLTVLATSLFCLSLRYGYDLTGPHSIDQQVPWTTLEALGFFCNIGFFMAVVLSWAWLVYPSAFKNR